MRPGIGYHSIHSASSVPKLRLHYESRKFKLYLKWQASAVLAKLTSVCWRGVVGLTAQGDRSTCHKGRRDCQHCLFKPFVWAMLLQSKASSIPKSLDLINTPANSFIHRFRK
jgi:hypothetical protein